MEKLRPALFLLLPLLMTVSSCFEPIQVVLPDEEVKVVALANFSPDDYIKVYLSEERPLSQDSTRYISEADINILINDRRVGTMRAVPADGTYPNKPFFQSNFRPGEGRSYTLEVNIGDNPQLRAVSKIPDVVPILSVRLDSTTTERLTLDRRETFYNFYGSIEIRDPATVKNYYHFAETITPIDWFTILQNDTILNPNQEHFLAPVFVLDTQDPAYIPLEHENGFLIDDATFDGQIKRIPFRASIVFDSEFRLVNRLLVLFRSVSADYFLYHSSLSKQIVAQSSPFSEPVIIFNNVENGLGNFSGYSTAIDSILIAR